METIKLEEFSFSYPNGEKKALDCINLTIHSGAFVVICGHSGCGKSTLLRNLKPILAPHGAREGHVLFDGHEVSRLSHREQSQKIGFVLQNTEAQIVTDKVWHELAFGLENLGRLTAEIRANVAEMATFFGMQSWFHERVCDLSGGQKQLLNLASVMVMQPEVLILDEPTAQLDPIAAEEFFQMLSKINREMGTTVILSEHRLEEAFSLADQVVVLEEGKCVAVGTPGQVGAALREQHSKMWCAMPTAMRVYGALEQDAAFPVSVNQGRTWLSSYVRKNGVAKATFPQAEPNRAHASVVCLSDLCFRYEKHQPDVISGLTYTAYKGMLHAILGGNGTGKTTLLSLICGQRRPNSGKVQVGCRQLGVLPQNPETLFVKKTVELDLYDMLADCKISVQEKEERLKGVVTLCNLEQALRRHPYDLSGGEKQRAALAKVLLMQPDLLLLDEPTKGMDAHFKEAFAQMLSSLTRSGVTIIMVSHDVEFCAKYADHCALMFDGRIVSEGSPRTFFAQKRFYTTVANRMARGIIEDAILAEDIISFCKKTEEKEGDFI